MISKGHIPALTGLRGVAALWVVFFHLFLGSSILIIKQGYLGVDIFFVLSGFVLSHVYSAQFKTFSIWTYGQFIRARIARIYPLHVLMLLVLALIVLALPGFLQRYTLQPERFGFSSFLASLFLIQSWFHWLPTCWNAPAWSLSSEWLAYLGFPAFVIVTQRWRSISVSLLLAMISLTLFVFALFLKKIPNPNVDGSLGLIRMASEFCCGCLFFRAKHLGLSKLPIWFEVFTYLFILVSFIFPSLIFLSPFGLATVILLSSENGSFSNLLLSTKPIVFLGEISYSIYLIHWIVIQVANWYTAKSMLSPLSTNIMNIFLIPIILIFAYFTYRTVELRARSWGRRVGIRTEVATANADAI